MTKLKSYFLTGLMIILPLLITFIIARFVMQLLTNPFTTAVTPLVDYWVSTGTFSPLFRQQLIYYLSCALILTFLILFIWLIGFLVRWYCVRSFIRGGEQVLKQIPLVNKIYLACSETIKTLFADDSRGFKQVVIVPFPSPYTLALGLIADTTEKGDEDQVTVYIPGNLNPANGLLLRFKRSAVIYTAIEVEEVLKYAISCGIIVPHFKACQPPKT